MALAPGLVLVWPCPRASGFLPVVTARTATHHRCRGALRSETQPETQPVPRLAAGKEDDQQNATAARTGASLLMLTASNGEKGRKARDDVTRGVGLVQDVSWFACARGGTLNFFCLLNNIIHV